MSMPRGAFCGRDPGERASQVRAARCYWHTQCAMLTRSTCTPPHYGVGNGICSISITNSTHSHTNAISYRWLARQSWEQRFFVDSPLPFAGVQAERSEHYSRPGAGFELTLRLPATLGPKQPRPLCSSRRGGCCSSHKKRSAGSAKLHEGQCDEAYTFPSAKRPRQHTTMQAA